MEKFRNAMQKISNGKAPEHDDTAVEMINIISELGCKTIVNLLNHIKRE